MWIWMIAYKYIEHFGGFIYPSMGLYLHETFYMSSDIEIPSKTRVEIYTHH